MRTCAELVMWSSSRWPLRSAGRWLRRRESVVLDATFGQPADRAAARQLARRTGARLAVLVCQADESVIKQRLAARASDTQSVSDARLELWRLLRAAFVAPHELSDAIHVDMSSALEQVASDVVQTVRTSPSGLRSPWAA